MKRNLTRRSSQRNDDETKEHQQEKLKDDDEGEAYEFMSSRWSQTSCSGNLTPQKIKLEEEEQQSPQTPKSDFANFAESILSPNALDTPIVSFADVLTPRLHRLSALCSLLLQGMVTFWSRYAECHKIKVSFIWWDGFI
jgi:hypothetical protein